MKFIAGVEIQPSAQFGVPQDDTIVVPAGTNITSAAIHTSSGTRFGHGTLSRFRDENIAIRKTLKILGLDCRLQDNFIHITLEAERGREAYDGIVDALDRFTKHLTLSMGHLFSYKVLFVESESRELYNLPRLITMISGTNYDLEHVSSKIDEAERMSALEDPVLNRALQYYEHAMFLFDRRNQIADLFSSHFRYMISEIFLNMWKAATAIIGDPSVDNDYRSRYRRLGIDREFFEKKIEVVRNIRNDYDVAHYRIDEKRLTEIERNYGLVKEVAERIIRDYRQYLSVGKPSFAEKDSLKHQTLCSTAPKDSP